MTRPFFVDMQAAMKARRENAQRAYAWRRRNVTDPATRLIHDAVERGDAADEALKRWIIEEMARGTDPLILPPALAVHVQNFLGTVAGSSGMPLEEAFASFARTFSFLAMHRADAIFGSHVSGTEGGAA